MNPDKNRVAERKLRRRRKGCAGHTLRLWYFKELNMRTVRNKSEKE